MRLRARLRARLRSLLLPLLLLAAVALYATVPAAADGGPSLHEIELACEGESPYYVVATHCAPRLGQIHDYDPSIVLTADTARDEPHYRVASIEQVGTVWGLAYARGEQALYAGAFHKRQMPFGPGGPGALYRIDLASGDVTQWVTVPDAGPDHHRLGRYSFDREAAMPAGRTSLGDVELSEDETTLFVVNLADRRIYRYRVADGALLGSFPHGAADEPWAEDARPFGLGVHEGWLYHGVVNTAESTGSKGEMLARVYRSRGDGSALSLELSFPLHGERGRYHGYARHGFVSLAWHPWKEGWVPPPRSPLFNPTALVFPMPLLSDIQHTSNGDMLLGFRDRFGDATTMYQRGDDLRNLPAAPIGDLLRAERTEEGWRVNVLDEPVDDVLTRLTSGISVLDESAEGALADGSARGRIVATMLRPHHQKGRVGAYVGALYGGFGLFDEQEGALEGQEALCSLDWGREGQALRPWGDAQIQGIPRQLRMPVIVGRTGDMEGLCPERVVPTPTPLPSPTATPSPRPTATPRPSATASPAPTATATAVPTETPVPGAIYLPLSLHDAPCVPKRRRADVVLVVDASTSMAEPTSAGRTKLAAAQEAARAFIALLGPNDRAALVSFNAEAQLLQGLTQDGAALDGAIDRIAMAELTRIHRGLRVALALLQARPDEPDGAVPRDGLILLLTDGRSNPDPVSEALAVAEEVREAGLRLVAVGLGSEVEAAALRAMATTPQDLHLTPDGEDLRAIYESIARGIPCPEEAFWPYPPGR